MSKVSLEQAECILKKYINSDIVLKKDFFNKYGITSTKRIEIVAVVKAKNPKLHTEYVNTKKPNVLKEEKLMKKMPVLKQIIDKIMFGIEGRKFDLLDYYQITSLSFSELYTLFLKGDFGEIEKQYLRDFISKNTLRKEYKYEVKKKQELSAKTIIREHEVSVSEKSQAFNMLDDLGLPYNRKLYNLAVRKVIREKERDKKYCKTKNNSI